MKANHQPFARRSSLLPLLFCSLAIGNVVLPAARAQILYIRAEGTGAQQVGKLRYLNPDGSGDTEFSGGVPNQVLPTWSHDGLLYSITKVDPARANQLSQNVFSANPATGAVTQVTHFQDNVNPFNQAYTYVAAFYKAYSPDRTLMAVNSLYASGAPNASQTTTPTLQIFRTDGEGGSQALVFTSVFRDGVHHAGEGVDWAPSGGNLLVCPVKNDVRQPSTGDMGEATALFFVAPTSEGSKTGKQVTFPRSDRTSNVATGEVTSFGEHDYQPKFSPGATKLAYVRSYQATSNYKSAPDPDIQSIRVIDDRSDHEIFRLQPGQYITNLDWSPDGAQLVFDAGRQNSSNGFYFQAAAAETDELFIVNLDGTGLHKLLGASNGQPAWRPALATNGVRDKILANISTRLPVGTGDNALIAGFIVTGTGSKKIVVRGIGPSLPFGDSLADPTLELRDSSGKLLAANDNWKDSQQAEVEATGVPPGNNLEAAIVATLPANNSSYTAILRGKNNTIGFGTVEAYDLDQAADAKLANISTRGYVSSGDRALIGGFICGANTKVVIRAIGPSLSNAGVNNPLPDPTLELRDANGTIVRENNDWKETQQAEIQATGVAPTNDRESALVQTLTGGGAYTAIVRGAGSVAGIGSVEVYNLP
ncbi:MAG: hypothetical protein M3Y69_01590 [Verrucomicrobiota bacterium]|nr:hypothetical protein [Verrucomicrobiota bacterium]